ncbi:MAG: PepSY domain-containing protein [Microcoleaceae cyanobacterium]
MPINQARLRQLHRTIAPIFVLPLLITLITGSLFQFAVLSQKGSEYLWLLDLHRGHFGRLNLEAIYPFLNALGLLTLLITGVMIWLMIPSRRSRS